MSPPGDNTRKRIFTRWEIVRIAVVFLFVFGAMWAAGRMLFYAGHQHGWDLDCPGNFPLSMFALRIPGLRFPLWPLGIAAGGLLVFVLLLWRLRPVARSVTAIILAGFVLVLGTSVIQGPTYGLVGPMRGPAQHLQYLHDAEQVTSAGEFVREFHEQQPCLSVHSRTHPPGAVLLYYALLKGLGHPAVMSVAVAALSVALSGGFLYGILRREVNHETAGIATFLFLLAPSVQVYYCATLDAVIAGCFLGVLFFFRCRSQIVSIAGAIVCLFCASYLTFAAVFLGPVLVGFELLTRRTVRRSAAVIFGVAVLYGAMYFFSGFNYLQAFSVASALENPKGFRLLAEPANYLITRVENVCEILVYFGPFLLVLFVRGVRAMARVRPRPELLVWTLLGIATLLAMFLTGAFHTGETARACLFIVPYLMFPVAAHLDGCRCRTADLRVLLVLVFGQTMAMQTFGGYYW